MREIINCGFYEWNGNIYTESGTYQETFLTQSNCDSIESHNVIIVEEYEVDDLQEVCNEYYWEGDLYTQSGVYTKTLVATNNCDSIVHLVLTVLDKQYKDTIAEACYSYTWGGQVYYTSGVYQQTFESQLTGCDSIVTNTITIHNKYIHYFDNVESCGAYHWVDKIYTESGEQTEIFQSVYGCDSIVTKNIIIKPLPEIDYIIGANEIIIQEGNGAKICEYEVSPSNQNYTYEWTIISDGWYIVQNNSPKCTVCVLNTGDAVLKVKAYHNGCASDEREIIITSYYGIDQYEDNSDVKLYPNPVSNELTIELINLESEVKIEIYDNAGKKLHSESIKISENIYHYKYSVQNLTNGMYMLVVNNKNKQFVRKYFVLK